MIPRTMCWNGREKIIVVSYVPISELVILIEPFSKYTILAKSAIKFILDHALIQDLRPLIHLFVLDHNYLDRFYTEFFGMKVLSRKDFPEQKYSTAVVGFGPEETHFVIGLTHNRKMDICHKFKPWNSASNFSTFFLRFCT